MAFFPAPKRKMARPLRGKTALASFWPVAALGLLLAGGALAGTTDSADSTGSIVNLSAPAARRPPALLGTGCMSVDPAHVSQGQPLLSNFDQPLCTQPKVSAPVNRELLRLSESDMSMKLGYVEATDQSLGLMRLLVSFSRFLNLGPLPGWQFRADAQLGRPLTLSTDNLLDERLKLFLGIKPGGWNLHFDVIAINRGAFDPAGGTRSLEFAADLSRNFSIAGWGAGHSLDLRLAQEKAQDPLAGSDAKTNRATLSYKHDVGFGTIGADVGLVHFSPAEIDRRTETRTEIKFSRPF